MAETRTIDERLIEHCLGTGEPLYSLLNTGTFPDGWVTNYLQLMEVVSSQWAGNALWPRNIAASGYVASVYCDKRYRDWLIGGGAPNKETEDSLIKIRWVGDSFLIGWWFREPTE